MALSKKSPAVFAILNPHSHKLSSAEKNSAMSSLTTMHHGSSFVSSQGISDGYEVWLLSRGTSGSRLVLAIV